MIRKFARRAVLGSVPLMILAAAGTAGASAPSASVQFQGQAALQPDGQVIVRVNYSCSPNPDGTSGTLEVRAQQVGAFGFGSLVATCDGRKHPAELFLGPGPFTAGSAAAIATVDSGTASHAEAQATLKVK